jgi:hypothetical protein
MAKMKAKQLLLLSIVSNRFFFQQEKVTHRGQTHTRRKGGQKNLLFREDFETEFG